MKATIKYLGVEITCEFDYQPYERPIYYYRDGSGHPGCEESIDNLTVYFKGEDITNLCEPHLENIEELIFEHIHDSHDN